MIICTQFNYTDFHVSTHDMNGENLEAGYFNKGEKVMNN